MDHEHDDECAHGEECIICAHGPDAYKKRVLDNIERTGLSITGVFPEPDSPGFTYSIGMHRHEMPDLIIFSVPPELGQHIMNALYAKAKEGTITLQDGEVVDDKDITSMPLVLRATDPELVEEYATGSYSLSSEETGHANSVLQIVWPDTHGRYPWDATFDRSFEDSQKELWITRN